MSMLSIAQVAEELGTTQKAVRRLIAAGSLKSEKKGSRYLIALRLLTNTGSRRPTGIQPSAECLVKRNLRCRKAK